jgi:hypothetical protein
MQSENGRQNEALSYIFQRLIGNLNNRVGVTGRRNGGNWRLLRGIAQAWFSIVIDSS